MHSHLLSAEMLTQAIMEVSVNELTGPLQYLPRVSWLKNLFVPDILHATSHLTSMGEFSAWLLQDQRQQHRLLTHPSSHERLALCCG